MGRVPERIGAYTVEGEIGRGGMGVVYRGFDSRLGRRVAIKALPDRLADDAQLMARFEREARTLAALNHPNIGILFDVEELHGRKYLILEFIEGETLADRLRRGPLRVKETLEVGEQIAFGLCAAHDAGFVHRDLKPANIKITPAGTVKILDFGLAMSMVETARTDSGGTTAPSPDDARTTPGIILGTVPYMSPEQLRGGSTDRRADLWALGVILHECLSGTNPFSRDSQSQCIAAILEEEPDLEDLPSATPRALAALVGRCLRKDPRLRQRDAGDARFILQEARDQLLDRAPAAIHLLDIADRTLRIDDAICRSLDRSAIDPLLPGWEMRYADNNRDSDALVIWIPSIGGDHTTSQWRELIAASSYRMVIVTPVGMEPGVDSRPAISLENQLALIRALTRHLRSSINPRRTVVSGFSCGSIMALRCAAGGDAGDLFDGVLAIEADLQESDCFVTRLFGGLDPSSSREVMQGLLTLSSSCESIRDWLVLHQHMVECVAKVQSDLSPLIRQGRQLSEGYEGVHTGAQSPFVGFLRDALDRVETVRCMFRDSADTRRILGEIRMMHIDDHVLGPRFTDETISFTQIPDHLGMMSNEQLLEQLDRIVEAVR
jgi:serine/threonine protein kinase